MSKKTRAERARERPCYTYWGSHGCKKQAGHSGVHVCSCRSVPAEGQHFYGESVDALRDED